MRRRTEIALLALIAATLLPAPANATGNPFERPPFKTPAPDMAAHWWRNFRDPSYCRMVLCHGQCAFRGDGQHSACSLIPLYPIVDASGCTCDQQCAVH